MGRHSDSVRAQHAAPPAESMLPRAIIRLRAASCVSLRASHTGRYAPGHRQTVERSLVADLQC